MRETLAESSEGGKARRGEASGDTRAWRGVRWGGGVDPTPASPRRPSERASDGATGALRRDDAEFGGRGACVENVGEQRQVTSFWFTIGMGGGRWGRSAGGILHETLCGA
jgi:hypothetical protein